MDLERKAQQVKNYLSGKAVILNIHITHQAGTYLCNIARDNGKVADFACLDSPDNAGRLFQGNYTQLFEYYREDKKFHFVSWEFRTSPHPTLSQMPWENENVVSILIVRNPIDRLLTSDGGVSRMFGKGIQYFDTETWYKYMHSSYTNNYALNILSGGDLTWKGLQKAKSLVDRFTFVLDQECLNDNAYELMKILNWENGMDSLLSHGGLISKLHQTDSDTTHVDGKKPAARSRIKNDNVYFALLRRNKLGMELYKYAKARSLVVCDELLASSNDASNDENQQYRPNIIFSYNSDSQTNNALVNENSKSGGLSRVDLRQLSNHVQSYDPIFVLQSFLFWGLVFLVLSFTCCRPSEGNLYAKPSILKNVDIDTGENANHSNFKKAQNGYNNRTTQEQVEKTSLL